MDTVEIAHPDVAGTAFVHPRSVEHHRRAGWSPVDEAPTDHQPDPAGPKAAPVAGASEYPEE